jgi:uncharacterized membrane protein YfcA
VIETLRRYFDNLAAFDPITWLLTALAVLAALFIYVWAKHILRARRSGTAENAGFPNPIMLAIGFVTDFLDTWSIGSFATTTALFKFFRQCPDRLIPGTLNVGHGLPTIVQAFIYIGIVKVDPATLIAMIGAAVAGAVLGAGVVCGLPKRKIQIGMGAALLVAAALLLRQQIQGDVQFKENAFSLEGTKLWIGIGVNFVLGALMTLGIGLYAPCMILVSLLGMNQAAAFPIMMGSCAFLMPIASVRFMRSGSYGLRQALGLAIGGIPAVFVAEYLFKKTAIETLRWIVLGVVVYTAILMLYSAYRANAQDKE